MPVRGGFFTTQQHFFGGLLVKGGMSTAHQVVFCDPGAGLDLGENLNVLIGSGMRCTHQGDFLLAELEMFVPAGLNKGQRLERFCA